MWPIDGCDFCITYIPSTRDIILCHTIIALVTHLHLLSDASTRLATVTSLDRFSVIAVRQYYRFRAFILLAC